MSATGVSPETIVLDQPETFVFAGFKPWRPTNYEDRYAGPVTWRRALAESRNVPAGRVAAYSATIVPEAKVAGSSKLAPGVSTLRTSIVPTASMMNTPARIVRRREDYGDRDGDAGTESAEGREAAAVAAETE